MLFLILRKSEFNSKMFYENLSQQKGIWHNGSTIKESFWLIQSNPTEVEPNYQNVVKAKSCMSSLKFMNHD